MPARNDGKPYICGRPRKQQNKCGYLIIRDIPEHFKRFFKAYCAKVGVSQNQAILDFIKKCAREEYKISMKAKKLTEIGL